MVRDILQCNPDTEICTKVTIRILIELLFSAPMWCEDHTKFSFCEVLVPRTLLIFFSEVRFLSNSNVPSVDKYDFLLNPWLQRSCGFFTSASLIWPAVRSKEQVLLETEERGFWYYYAWVQACAAVRKTIREVVGTALKSFQNILCYIWILSFSIWHCYWLKCIFVLWF